MSTAIETKLKCSECGYELDENGICPECREVEAEEKAEKEYWAEYEEMKANQSQYQHLR